MGGDGDILGTVTTTGSTVRRNFFVFEPSVPTVMAEKAWSSRNGAGLFMVLGELSEVC